MNERLSGRRAPRPADIWVVEDNAAMRTTLAEVLDNPPLTTCSLACATAEEALTEIAAGRAPTLVLMDLGLPGIGGIAGIEQICHARPDVRVIVLTVHDDEEHVFKSLRAGASGYLMKPVSATQLTAEVTTALQGGAPMNAFIARRVLRHFGDSRPPKPEYGLTARERDVLLRLVNARTIRQIAEELSVSPHTIDTHVRSIYTKLHVTSRSGAVATALRKGLVGGGEND